MFPYKTNSADYLDYVAANLTREEILANPDLCVLLENPYIKDNMEVALAWRAAKFGDYQDKYNFVEFYLCNGPELDADTLLHYRALAQADPVIMEIAYSYFTDPEYLSQVREKKYGKKKEGDWTDCFRNPCFYLGDFSGVMGSMGDSKNVDTYFNILGEKISKWWDSKKKLVAKKKNEEQVGMVGSILKGMEESAIGSAAEKVGSLFSGGNDTIEPDDEMTPDKGRSGDSPTSAQLESKVRPSYDEGWRKLGRSIFENDVEFAKQMCEKTKWACPLKHGDWFSRTVSKQCDLIDKANTTRMLGDCYRMWSQVRGLRIFGKDNQYKPITSDQLVENRMPDGTVRIGFNNSHPTPADATKGVDAGIAERARTAPKSGLFDTHTNTTTPNV